MKNICRFSFKLCCLIFQMHIKFMGLPQSSDKNNAHKIRQIPPEFLWGWLISIILMFRGINTKSPHRWNFTGILATMLHSLIRARFRPLRGPRGKHNSGNLFHLSIEIVRELVLKKWLVLNSILYTYCM